MKKILLSLAGLALLTLGAAERLRVSLPETIYAMPGVECNIYFDSAVNVINPANYFFEVRAPKGRNDVKRWRFVPEEKDCGTFELRLNVYDDDGLAGSAVTKIVVAPKTTEKKARSILLIGSSETAAGVYPARILELLKDSGFRLCGTVKRTGYAPDVVTEGYPGWSYAVMIRDAKSPILFDGKLDFPRYIREKCAGHAPDVITITFGGNDAFGLGYNPTQEKLSRTLAHAETLVAELRRGAPDALIGVGLTYQGAGQDAFGANYGCLLSARQFRINHRMLIEGLRKKFERTGDKKLSIIPIHLNVDSEHNFPTRSEPVSQGSSQTIVRQSNARHPAPAGYRQVGDAISAWINGKIVELGSNIKE